MKSQPKKSERVFSVFTAEYREYAVTAKSYEEAKQKLEEADIQPKEEGITVLQWGDFEIINTE